MLELGIFEPFKRTMRLDGWDEIGVSTWTKIKEAIQEGRYQEACELVDYLNNEGKFIHDEQVPAEEKIVSIFEPHTDIIKKDRRETFYGHKICLTSGRSNLISDCLILEGNPADSSLTVEMLDRHDQIYGHYPLKVALDGGFASKDNLKIAKGKEIKDVCFAKKRGVKEEDMCRSP